MDTDGEADRGQSFGCFALDSGGAVFKLIVSFTPESAEEERKILSDIMVGNILGPRGYYSISQDKEDPTAFHDPIYTPLSPEYSREETGEAFHVNNTADKIRLI